MSETLSEKLAERIRRDGPVSFRDFMETALYDPEDGYYVRNAAIGHGGDFVTSPTISPLFARTVARLFAADGENFSGDVVFCEVGAGNGTFLRDFRAALTDLEPAAASRTRVWAIERSETGRRAIAAGCLADRIAPAVGAFEGERVEGWVFSNELYDALPVHRVVGGNGRIDEIVVGMREGRLAWSARPAPGPLSDYLARFGVTLEPGQIAEINLEAAPLHRSLGRLVARGRLLTFDYGHRAPVLYHPHARRSGTLAVHARGRRGGDPLTEPGDVDLTAHVNWDDLERAGEAEGFVTERRMRQSEFLLSAGLFQDAGARLVQDAGRPPADETRDGRVGETRGRHFEAIRLFDPEGLGDDLSVLLQSKGMSALVNFFTLTSPG